LFFKVERIDDTFPMQTGHWAPCSRDQARLGIDWNWKTTIDWRILSDPYLFILRSVHSSTSSFARSIALINSRMDSPDGVHWKEWSYESHPWSTIKIMILNRFSIDNISQRYLRVAQLILFQIKVDSLLVREYAVEKTEISRWGFFWIQSILLFSDEQGGSKSNQISDNHFELFSSEHQNSTTLRQLIQRMFFQRIRWSG